MVGGVGTGSAFVIDSSGYLLTNYHVIADAEEIRVNVGSVQYIASVVGMEPDLDLALLKISASDLPCIPLGRSNELKIGDVVYTIGCPRGICGTMTRGMVANVNESGILMDLTLASGSSGGPLINSNGEAVGVTTSVLMFGSSEERSRMPSGFSYAVPITAAIPLLEKIPGFSTSGMGKANQELELEHIRARANQAVAFVESDQQVPLVLPEGYTWTSPSAWPGTAAADNDALIGYLEGIADQHEWTRQYYGKAGTFQKQLKVLIAQMDTPYSAQELAQKYRCCPETWSGTDCSDCLEDRSELFFSSTDTYKGASVTRELSSSSYTYLHGSGRVASLTYSIVVQAGAYVIRVCAAASLDIYASLPIEESLFVWATSEGIVVQKLVLKLGKFSKGPKHFAITYGEFAEWATARGNDALEYILSQL